DELRARLVLADRPAPLHPFHCPFASDPQSCLVGGEVGGGQAEAARVQGHEGDLQTLAFGTDHVLLGHAHVVEAEDAVLDSAQAHERVAALDLETGHFAHDYECGDSTCVTIALGDDRHHEQQLGDGSVCGPELGPVEDVCRPVVGRHG